MRRGRAWGEDLEYPAMGNMRSTDFVFREAPTLFGDDMFDGTERVAKQRGNVRKNTCQSECEKWGVEKNGGD